jgi:hypothetical protein
LVKAKVDRLPKWACDACGYSSGRKWCVDRHIANPNIHGGKANRIATIEYIAAIQKDPIQLTIAQMRDQTEKQEAKNRIGKKFNSVPIPVQESADVIFTRRRIERFAELQMDWMIEDLRNGSDDDSFDVMAELFKNYNDALEGKINYVEQFKAMSKLTQTRDPDTADDRSSFLNQPLPDWIVNEFMSRLVAKQTANQTKRSSEEKERETPFLTDEEEKDIESELGKMVVSEEARIQDMDKNSRAQAYLNLASKIRELREEMQKKIIEEKLRKSK